MTVVGNYLHAHEATVGMALRHIRDGVELEPIDVNEHYDFDYQQITLLEEEKKILPGDSLMVQCLYDTNHRDKITWSGFGARDEMCESVIMVYPIPSLNKCFSGFNIEETIDWMLEAREQGFIEMDDPQAIFTRVGEGNWTALNDIKWNSELPGAVSMYERLWQDDAVMMQWCADHDQVSLVNSQDSSFNTAIGNFTPWRDGGECDAFELDWDDYTQYIANLQSSEHRHSTTSAVHMHQHSLLFEFVVFGTVLCKLFGF